MNCRLHSTIRNYILILIVLLVACNNENSSQEEIALEYLDSFYGYNWTKMSQLLHPDNLESFRTTFIKGEKEYEKSHKGEKFTLLSDSVLSRIDTVKNEEKKLELFYATFMEIAFPNDIMKMINEELNPKYKIIGTLNTKSDTSYVVYKASVFKKGERATGENVLSLKKYQNEWRVLLPPEIRKMIQDRNAAR